MYSPKVIAANAKKIEAAYGISLKEHSLAECEDWVTRIALAFDGGKQLRPLLAEEQRFILNEISLAKISFIYWSERYAAISLAGSSLGRLFPLLDSQEFVLAKLSELEEQCAAGERVDGLLLNVLKAARQVGVSTLAEALIAHRITTQNNLQALISSNVPGERGSGYLFGMLLRVIDNLPLWLKPTVVARRESGEEYLELEGGSRVFVGAGKSMQGSAGDRGQLGRGMTASLTHLSELSTWENPNQIDESLLPAMPTSPWTLAIFESTARGRGNNWWHLHWRSCRGGRSRFCNVFIPWYVERKYSLPAPPAWSPASDTLSHAKRIEETSSRWAGRRVIPTRSQLYWYEFTRDSFLAKDDLRSFLENFGSIDDDECFQQSGRGVFTPLELQQMQSRMLGPIAALEIVRRGDIRA